MPTRSVLEAIRDALHEEMQDDERVFVLGEDVEEGGVFRATDGLLQKFGQERVMDTPLAESSIVGVAIGSALNGLLPVAEIQFSDFILPAMNQIISEAAKLRYRTAGDFSCPIVIRSPYGGGIRGGLYHSQSMETLFTHQPGLKVICPATPYDYKGLLKAAIRDPDPVLFFEHKKTYHLIKGEVPDRDYTVPIGKAEVRRRGDDLTVFSYGLALHYCLDAAEKLAREEGIESTVVDLRTLQPLDRETILEEAKATGKILIVHEDNLTCGVGAEIAATIAQAAFEYLDAPIMRLAGPDVPAVPYAQNL
jgi:2-oxoisovalerate dehydrogenase E1 component beta subunit